MGLIKTGRQIGRTLKNASRLRTIVGVFAKHGFSNIAERIKLGRFVLDRLNARDDIENFTIPERVRMSFEELGPTFVKLGQLLGSRPDLVPADFVAEFEKLQDRVQPMGFEVVEQVLNEEFNGNYKETFSFLDSTPLGSASIAQVHRARLKDGTNVVVKVQRPGLIQKINDDLNVLYFLAELLEAYVPETRPFNPVAIVDEYFKTLELETNFVVEANNIRRFSQNFKDDPSVKIPQVYFSATTERVLTLEAFEGLPLSAGSAADRSDSDATEVIRRGLRAYLKMVFIDGLFHGDLHAGNFFVLPGNTIGLIDFGVVGRLNHRTQTAIANMLQALAKEDYERLAYEYIDLAPFNDRVSPDLFAKDLRDLIAPFYGLTLKNVNLGKILLGSSSIAARHHIAVPAELMLFFKSMVNIEALGKRIQPDFDFLNYALEFAAELVQAQYDPNRILSDVTQVLRDSKNLISAMPRQLHFLFKKMNSPNHAFRIRIPELEEMSHVHEVSFKLIFLGIVIAALLLSSALVMNHPTDSIVAGMPTISFVGYVLAAVFGFIAFINYIRK